MRRIVVTVWERSRPLLHMSKRPGRVFWPVARASDGSRTTWWEVCRRRSAAWSPHWKKTPTPALIGTVSLLRRISARWTGSSSSGSQPHKRHLPKRNGRPSRKRIGCAQPRSSLQASVFSCHNRGGAHGRPAGRPPIVAVYGAVLPGEPRGGPSDRVRNAQQNIPILPPPGSQFVDGG